MRRGSTQSYRVSQHQLLSPGLIYETPTMATRDAHAPGFYGSHIPLAGVTTPLCNRAVIGLIYSAAPHVPPSRMQPVIRIRLGGGGDGRGP